MFSKKIKAVYFYTVSFISLLMLIFGLISLASSIINYSFTPPQNLSSYYGQAFDYQLQNIWNNVAVVAVVLIVFLSHWVYVMLKLMPDKNREPERLTETNGGEDL